MRYGPFSRVPMALSVSQQIEPQAPVALRLAAVTGARRSELAALRWDDLSDGRLTDRLEHRRDPRQRAPSQAHSARRPDEDREPPSRVARSDHASDPGGAPRGVRQLRSLDVGGRSGAGEPRARERWWRRARDLAKVDSKWRLHDLRHWSATVSIAQGHDIRTVANRLGHANPSMTLRTYAHAVESADAPVAATLGLALDGDDSFIWG